MSGGGAATVPDGEHAAGALRGGRRARRATVAVTGALVVLALIVWAVVARQGPADGAPPAPAASSLVDPDATAEPVPSGAAAPDTSSGETVSPTSPAPADPPPAQPPVGEPTAAETAPPVALDAPADFGTGVTAEVFSIEAVTGEARGVGEVAGPAVRLTLVVRNDSADAVALNRALVDVYSGAAEVPAQPVSGPGAQPFTGTVPPGAEATGVYVFGVPVDDRDDVRVTLSYVPEVPTVVFEGAAPRP